MFVIRGPTYINDYDNNMGAAVFRDNRAAIVHGMGISFIHSCQKKKIS